MPLYRILLRSYKIIVSEEINKAKIIIFKMEEIHKVARFDKV